MSSYECDRCHRQFDLASTLKQHTERKNPCDITHKCNSCGKIFPTRSKLDRHSGRKTSCSAAVNMPKMFSCELCNKQFTRKASKERHCAEACPVRKMSPEEWIDYVDILNDRLEKTRKEKEKFFVEREHMEQKYEDERKKTDRLSQEYKNVLRRLGNAVEEELEMEMENSD